MLGCFIALKKTALLLELPHDGQIFSWLVRETEPRSQILEWQSFSTSIHQSYYSDPPDHVPRDTGMHGSWGNSIRHKSTPRSWTYSTLVYCMGLLIILRQFADPCACTKNVRDPLSPTGEYVPVLETEYRKRDLGKIICIEKEKSENCNKRKRNYNRRMRCKLQSFYSSSNKQELQEENEWLLRENYI